MVERGAKWTLAVVTVVVWALLGGLFGWLMSPAKVAGPPLALTTANGMEYFIAQYRVKFGTTLADEATFYPDYVVVERKSARGGVESYRFDGKFKNSSASFSRASAVRELDLSKIDIAKVAGLLNGAPQTLKAQGGITHINVEHPPASTGVEPTIAIYVQPSGHMQISFAGEPLTVHPASR